MAVHPKSYTGHTGLQVTMTFCPECRTSGVVRIRNGKMTNVRYCPRCNTEWTVGHRPEQLTLQDIEL